MGGALKEVGRVDYQSRVISLQVIKEKIKDINAPLIRKARNRYKPKHLTSSKHRLRGSQLVKAILLMVLVHVENEM